MGWTEWTSIVDGPFGMVVMIMLIVFGFLFLSGLMEEIRKYACHRRDTDLKQEMVDRGMSAEEIKTVIEAEAPLADGTERWIASWGKKN